MFNAATHLQSAVSRAFSPTNIISAPALLLAATIGAYGQEFFDPPNSNYTSPTSINSKNQIAGYFHDTSYHGFVRAPHGAITVFDPPNSAMTWVFGINDGGTIVGEFSESVDNVVMHGFERAYDGTITTFDPGGSTNTMASAINDSGSIVGNFDDTNGGHGFLRSTDGTFTTIDVPNATGGTAPVCINASGTIGGYYGDAQGEHGFVRTSDGTITAFDPSGSVEIFVTGINSDGTIVGSFTENASNATWHGFLRTSDGTITTFDANKSRTTLDTYAESINDKGLIAGDYYCFGHCGPGSPRGFVRAADGTVNTFGRHMGIFVTGISNSKATTGAYEDSKKAYHGFIWVR